MRKIKGLGTLLLAGMLLIGCGGKNTDNSSSKKEEDIQTPEATEAPAQEPSMEPTEEPTQEAEDAEEKNEHEIDLPDDQKLVADYTSVNGLILEKGTRIAFARAYSYADKSSYDLR